MTVKIINFITYLTIVALMFSLIKFYHYIAIIQSIVIVLVLIFSLGVLINIFKRSKTDNVEVNTFEKVSLLIIALISCFISSVLIGSQYHDIYSGNPLASFGPPIDLILLSFIYPLAFSLLFFCLSVYKKWILDFSALIIWEVVSIYTAYFYDYKMDVGDTGSDGSSYFSSETKLITPLMQILIGLFIVFLLLKNKSVYQRVQKILSNIKPWINSKILKKNGYNT